jgi:nanoRNase/pAp phosphatase (c-di-AMP/oligoRNAs hydrolase)
MAARGKSMEATENVRHRLERLKRVCDGARDVRIIIYANPDPDALASALALKKILETKHRTVSIGYTGATDRPR